MKQNIFYIFLISCTYILSAQTQTEMNISSYNKYEKIDQELNEIYNQILIDYQEDSLFLTKLKDSQNLWMQFRDAEIEMKYPKPNKRGYYGSMYPLCANSLSEKITNQRISTLEQWLKPIPEGEGCRGSIMYRDIEEQAFTIDSIESYQLGYVLNNLEILKEFKTEELSIRIFAVGNYPGSARMNNSEITHNIYFTISEFDEFPEHSLFKVGEFYNPKVRKINLANALKPIVNIEHGPSNKRITHNVELSIESVQIIK